MYVSQHIPSDCLNTQLYNTVRVQHDAQRLQDDVFDSVSLPLWCGVPKPEP